MEAVRLRVKDIDYQMKQLTVRSGKGDKDRFTTFPATLTPLLQNHLARVKTLHQQDLARSHGAVYLPHALARKYPQTETEWGWQYVFPARGVAIDPCEQVSLMINEEDHLRIQVMHSGLDLETAWDQIDTTVLRLPEEQQIIKRLLQYPDLLAAAARAREPHRIAYWLQELAGLFHPYYKAHRIIQDDRLLATGRLALCLAVGQVVASGLDLLGVSAPESM